MRKNNNSYLKEDYNIHIREMARNYWRKEKEMYV